MRGSEIGRTYKTQTTGRFCSVGVAIISKFLCDYSAIYVDGMLEKQKTDIFGALFVSGLLDYPSFGEEKE